MGARKESKKKNSLSQINCYAPWGETAAETTKQLTKAVENDKMQCNKHKYNARGEGMLGMSQGTSLGPQQLSQAGYDRPRYLK